MASPPPPFSIQQLEYAVSFIKSNELQKKYPNEFWKITANKLHEKFHIAILSSLTVKNRVMSFLVSHLYLFDDCIQKNTKRRSRQKGMEPFQEEMDDFEHYESVLNSSSFEGEASEFMDEIPPSRTVIFCSRILCSCFSDILFKE